MEAIKGMKRMSELASEYEVDFNQITRWEQQVVAELPEIFSERRRREGEAEEALKGRLYQEIGQLGVELAWLKKSCFEH